jgi:hypothetical protein
MMHFIKFIFFLFFAILLHPSSIFAFDDPNTKAIDIAIREFPNALATPQRIPASKDKIKCYIGSTLLPSDHGVAYEIYPELNFLRVRLTSVNSDNDWLYMNIQNIINDNLVKPNEAGDLIIFESIKQLILAVGSGLIKQDLMRVNLTCWERDNCFLYTKKIETPSEGLVEVKFLVLNEDSRELLCYSKYGRWYDLPSNK